jgi:hypothetical protein
MTRSSSTYFEGMLVPRGLLRASFADSALEEGLSLYMTVDEFTRGKRVKNVVEALFVRLQEEELAPEALVWGEFLDAVIVGQHVEEMEVQLDNLGLK